MKIAVIIVSSILTVAAFASATAKLRKSPQVVAGMTHVGVRENQIPLLALIEITAGVGLLVGFVTKDLGRLAAAGLVLYFVGAIAAHVRIRDKFTSMAPALILLLVSMGTLVLQLQR